MPVKSTEPNPKILDSKQKIMVYCGNITERVFRKYIKWGLPAFYDEGSGWIAYTENIDEFFKSRTRVSMATLIDRIPEEPER